MVQNRIPIRISTSRWSIRTDISPIFIIAILIGKPHLDQAVHFGHPYAEADVMVRQRLQDVKGDRFGDHRQAASGRGCVETRGAEFDV